MLREDPLRIRLTRLLVARRIAEARAEAGMTQQQVADAVGRGQGWVSDTEGGLRRLEVAELIALAKVLGRPAGWFVRNMTDVESEWATWYRASLEGNQKRLAPRSSGLDDAGAD